MAPTHNLDGLSSETIMAPAISSAVIVVPAVSSAVIRVPTVHSAVASGKPSTAVPAAPSTASPAVSATVVAGASPEAVAAAAPVKAAKPVMAAGIDRREPVARASVFASGSQVYCWTKVTAASLPVKVKFVWSVNGRKVHQYTAEINLPTERWWSVKEVYPGSWKVELFSESGESLGSARFFVPVKPKPRP